MKASLPHFISRVLLLALAWGVAPAHAAYTVKADGTVTDTATGLVWEQCSQGLYTSSTACGTGRAATFTWDQALAVVTARNLDKHLGYSDWRLPNKNELESLVNLAAGNPAIDATTFPRTPTGTYFWSATSYAPDPLNKAWGVLFSAGSPYPASKSGYNHVRLVRGGQAAAAFDALASAGAGGVSGGTVTDAVTGLVWERCSLGLFSSAAVCDTGRATVFTWDQALAEVSARNFDKHLGYSDWRLPNKNELESIVNLAAGNPAIDATTFPHTPTGTYFWSATSYAPDPLNKAWGVFFNAGSPYPAGKSGSNHVRLVRGGQAFAAFDVFPVDGACGSAHGNLASSVPSSNLCSSGTASGVSTGASAYTWSCTGSSGGANSGTCSASRGDTATPSTPTVINASSHAETTLTGSTPVNATPGSTVVIPAGTNVAGTPIVLAPPEPGSSSDQPVTLKMNGMTFTVSSQSGAATVTLKKVAVNGQDTLVLAVSGGAVAFSAPAGTPFLALSGGIVSAGVDGASVTSDGAALAVASGSITLSGEANSFAAALTLTVYAGEVAEKNAAGKIALRVGSLSGADGAVGDPLKVAADPRRRMPAALNLSGKLGRLGSQAPLDAIAAALGQASLAQNADGTLGPGIAAVLLGINVDAGRADGVTRNGMTEVVKNGVVFRLAPIVNDFAAFLDRIDQAAGASGAAATLDSDGVLNLVGKGRQYAARAALALQAASGADGFTQDDAGNLVWANNGIAQTIYPAFRIVEKLRAELLALDPQATIADNGDGNYAITLADRRFTLRPDFQLLNLFDFPASHAKDGWWLDGAKVYLNYGNVTAQGMGVK
ncbi:MAG: DUF1566 domain-containing protein [Sulfuricella sp.]|nr:DUF1566 domain-containing protein [Sulfuricella sp.]